MSYTFFCVGSPRIPPSVVALKSTKTAHHLGFYKSGNQVHPRKEIPGTPTYLGVPKNITKFDISKFLSLSINLIRLVQVCNQVSFNSLFLVNPFD